jgi:hypothetical protein
LGIGTGHGSEKSTSPDSKKGGKTRYKTKQPEK